MLLFYIRHGDPIYRPDSLTPLGKRQAESVAHRLGAFGLDKIYSSSSSRAYETALPTAELLRLEVEKREFCTENRAWSATAPLGADGRCCWLFQSPLWRSVLRSPEIVAMGKEWYLHEKFKDTPVQKELPPILDDCDAFLAELGYRHLPSENRYIAEAPSDRRIALFAHQGFGMIFLSHILDVPYPLFASHFDMGHSGVTVIEFAPDGAGIVSPTVLTLSNDSHLFRDGIPTNYQNRIRF